MSRRSRVMLSVSVKGLAISLPLSLGVAVMQQTAEISGNSATIHVLNICMGALIIVILVFALLAHLALARTGVDNE